MPDMRRFGQPLLVALAGLVAVACQREASPPQPPAARDVATNLQIFAVKGLVRELDLTNAMVRIEHEAIPGYMEQMTMPFEVKDTNDLAGLLIGDAVSFRLLISDTEGWIDQIVKIPHERVGLKPKPRAPVRVTRIVEPLNVGDPIPDYPFTNELGRMISLHQFRGQALGLTFIFTRCPYPNFCPRMSAHFAQACQQLVARAAGPTNWHLLSVSFDPDYDTPSVLKQYAEGYGYDPRRWNFATGAMIEIDAITEQFGMVFAPDGSSFSHNVRTVVIDAQGRVQRIFVGNDWPVADFVAELVKAAGATAPAESSANPVSPPAPAAASP
jgi:protein SCO1/2